MRRLAVTVAIAGALLIPATASAHPSETRNPNGFGGGPHCHINLMSGNLAVPSHTAHMKQIELKPNGTVFQALGSCP
jgi:hypothetical protein